MSAFLPASSSASNFFSSLLMRRRYRIVSLCSAESGLLRVRHHALLDLVGREVFDVGGELPDVAERIFDHAPAIAPEHVHDGRDDLGARRDGLAEHGVDVL